MRQIIQIKLETGMDEELLFQNLRFLLNRLAPFIIELSVTGPNKTIKLNKTGKHETSRRKK